MMQKPLLIFYYLPTSAYALNVLIGALEKFDLDLQTDIQLPRDLSELHRILDEQSTCQRKIVVFWSFFSAAFPTAVTHLAETISRTNGDNVIHIAGGVHASAEPQQTLSSGFDFVAVGEGEETIVGIARQLIAGRDISNVPGINYLENEVLMSAKPAKRIELDDFPPFAVRNRRFNPIEITRGCIYACKFCQTPFMFKAKFRHRSVNNVIKYVTIMRNLGMKDIRFITPTSLSYGSDDETVNLERVEELLSNIRSVIGADGKLFFGSFPSEIRPEHASPEAFRMLKKYIDNDNIIIGGQSGSERILDSSKRGHGVEDIERAVRYAVEGGFVPNVDFLFGLPGETNRDAQESINLADRLAEAGARIHGHTFMPLPGTPFKDDRPGTISPKICLLYTSRCV